MTASNTRLAEIAAAIISSVMSFFSCSASGALDHRLSRLLRRLVGEPPEQKLMFDFHRRRQLEFSSKPSGDYHWLTLAAVATSPRTTGTRIGGTSQSLICSLSAIDRSFQKKARQMPGFRLPRRANYFCC
jgi:hypothetical protein